MASDAVRKVFKSARALKSLKNSFVLAFTLIVTVNIVGTLSVLFTEYWEIKGANIFFNIVFPVLKPTFFAITILTFLTGLGAMSAPLIVGGENFQTINPMIITFSRSNSSRDVAALLAILLGAATILLLAVFSHIEKGGNYVSVSKTKAKLQKQKINSPILNIIAHIVAYVMFLIYLVSIVYSLLAALLAVTITVICARFVKKAKRKYDVAFEWGMLIPWLLPSTLIALGLSTTYGERHAIIFNQVLVGTLVRMLLSAVALYFGQGDGMKRLQSWKQKRLEKKVRKMMES